MTVIDRTVIPRFRAIPILYRQIPVLLYSAAEASSSRGLVPLRVNTMWDIAESRGFTPGDRYLRLTNDLPSGSLVVGGPLGALLEQEGKAIGYLAEITPPDQAWLAAASTSKRVLVALGVPVSDGEIDLRAMLGAGRAFCGWADVILIPSTSADIGRYTLLGLDGRTVLQPTDQSVLLDSNVLVHMEKVANGSSRDSDRDRDVQNAVLSLIHQDVVAGFAIGELGWDRASMTWDDSRARKLRATVDAWFDGGAQRAANIADVQHAYREEMHRPNSPDAEVRTTFPTQLIFYVCLLKIAALWQEAEGGYRALQRIDLYSRFAAWMRDELGLILSYPMQVAHDRFVGPQQREAVEYIDRLLKLGKNPLQKLWGAAWDLAHLSNVDQAVDPDYLATAGRAPHLLTGDAALPHLRDRLKLATMQLFGTGQLVLMRHSAVLDKRLTDHEAPIRAIEADLREHALGRTPSTPAYDRILNLARDGEYEFLGTPSKEAPVPEPTSPGFGSTSGSA